MSQDNVEVVRGMCEAFLAGDIAVALDAIDAQVAWHGTIGGLDAGRVYHGHEEVIQAFADNLEAWERHSLDTQRFIGAGDRVVVFWHEVGRGKGSGVEIESDTAVIYTVGASGKVVHAQGYTDRAEALAAVGLRE